MSSCVTQLQSCSRCDSHFLNCSLLEETTSYLRLRCQNCDFDFSVPNTESQRRALQNVYGAPSQVDQLFNISQLREGDVIAYKRVAYLFKYEHHAVVTNVNRQRGEVTVVEFAPHLPLKSGVIVKSVRNFETEIATQNAWVRRYMPLDALPVPVVLERANSFISDPNSQPKYDLVRCNCQHLSSWCKTGEFTSAEANTARLIYFFTFHGFQIISMFVNPVLTIGMSVLDTTIRVGRMIRSEIDLVKKEMVTWDRLLGDIGSMAITTTIVGAALIAIIRATVRL